MKPKKGVVSQPASSTSPVANNSTFNLCKLIKMLNRKKLFALKWLQKIGMLNRETACDHCGRPMTLVHRQNCTGSRTDKYEWECSKCRMCTKSLRSGTVFQSSKLSLQKITILMYFWAHDFPPHVALRELSITERTVNKWYLLCQEACMDALIRNTSKLGGEGRNLEVIEGKLGKRAMDNYRTPAEHPAIGVIDVDSGSCFLQVVIGNTKATLLTLLKERVANGTTLHSKCWRARDCYGDDKFCRIVKNHKLTLINEEGNLFQKLHAKVCKSEDKEGTEISFDPILCAAIYKNAMQNEDFFFVKFLGELGTLYRDGIRYEMMSQLEHSDLEPGPSNRQRMTVKLEKTEWTSTVGSPCHRCRSKQYSDSEVQATLSDEITVCEDTQETQNVSISKRNARNSGRLSGVNGSTSDDIIMLEDTCKSRNGGTTEQTAHLSGYIRREQSSPCDEVMEVEEPDRPTDDSGLEGTANSSGHIPEADCAEASEVFVLEKHDELPNSSMREKNTQISKHSSKGESCAANNVVFLEGDGNLQDDGSNKEVGQVSEHDDVIDIGGDELKEVERNADKNDDKRSEAVTNVGHIDEIDISMEEQNDERDKVDERQRGETSVDEGDVEACEQDSQGDIDVMADGDSEKAAQGLHDEDSDITLYEQRDARTDGNVTAERQSCTVSKVVNIDTVEDNTAEEKVVPTKMIVPTKRSTDVASDVNIDDAEDNANGSTVKGSKTNTNRKREADSGLINIDDAEDNSNECSVKDSQTSASPGRKRVSASDLVNIDDAEDNANECSVEAGKTNSTADKKREAAFDQVNASDTEDNANESTIRGSKTKATPGGKRDAAFDLLNIDDAEDEANECTVEGSGTNATAPRKSKTACDLVNIDDAEDNADERTVKRSKTNETVSGKDAACDLVNIDDGNDNVDERTVNHSKTTPGEKRDSASDLVDIDDAEGNANESTAKCSKTTASAERKREIGSALVNIDDTEDNANKQKDVSSKRNSTAKRKSDAPSDVVNIDDLDDSSNERKDVLGKRNATAKRKSDATSDVVNIDDVDDNGVVECKRNRKSANQTARKASVTFTDVIDIDEVDSDVEVIETEVQSGPDVMVVSEQKRKVFQKEESQQHERRLLVDDVPCSLSKAALKTHFGKFGIVEHIKILPLPSRRSLRYAVLEFKTKEIVDTIQAARPHVLESGVQLVTFRGSSPDIDSSLNTRLKERMIVKVQKDNAKLTTEDVQQYFAGYGHIYHIERVTLTGVESGCSTYVVSFEDYDSADVACIKSPHTIKGVQDITCEKIEDDDLLLSGTEMDPICIENDSDVEEVQISDTKREPSLSRQSEEVRGLDEPSTSGMQSGGGKRLSDEVNNMTPKKFCSYNTFERNTRTPQNMTLANPTPSVSSFPGTRPATITNGRFGLPAMPGGSGYGGQGSGTISWHPQGAPGRPSFRNPVQRPAQSATPAPRAVDAGDCDGAVSATANGAAAADSSVETIVTVGALLAAAIRRGEEFRKRQAEVRPYRPQPPLQRPLFHARLPQWQQGRRLRPQQLQPRRAQPWPPVKREALSPTRPGAPAGTQRILPAGVPIVSSGPANTRSFIPRASGPQGPRF